MRPKVFNPFRFAGVLTILVLMALAAGGILLAPKPQATVEDGPWLDARRWVVDHPGTALVICAWPDGVPTEGRLLVGDSHAPAFFDQGQLVQAVPADAREGLVADDTVRAWVTWGEQGCRVRVAAPTPVSGRLVAPDGTTVLTGTVTGCGLEPVDVVDGTFEVVVPVAAWRDAVGVRGEPTCPLSASGVVTTVRLGAGPQAVLVEGPS